MMVLANLRMEPTRVGSWCGRLIRIVRQLDIHEPMMEATELFSRIFITLPTRWSDIYGFRQVAALGLPHAAKILASDHLRSARHFILDPANEEVFLDKAKFIESSGGSEVMGAAMTRKQLATFKASVDSASLVFMHSALDGAALDLCRVTALLAPEDWEPFLAAQKVALSDVKAVGYGAIFDKRLAEYLNAFERESLSTKADRLFQLCQPPRGFSPVAGYQFDRDKLIAVDRARHDLVDYQSTMALPNDVEAAIEFLLNTGMFLLGLVN